MQYSSSLSPLPVSSESPRSPGLLDLPPELFHRICLYLPPESILIAGSLCRKLHTEVCDNDLWIALLKHRFGSNYLIENHDYIGNLEVASLLPGSYDNEPEARKIYRMLHDKSLNVTAERLHIAWGDNPRHWRQVAPPPRDVQEGDSETINSAKNELYIRRNSMMRLLSVCWFDVQATFESVPVGTYDVILVVKTSNPSFAEYPVKVSVTPKVANIILSTNNDSNQPTGTITAPLATPGPTAMTSAYSQRETTTNSLQVEGRITISDSFAKCKICTVTVPSPFADVKVIWADHTGSWKMGLEIRGCHLVPTKMGESISGGIISAVTRAAAPLASMFRFKNVYNGPIFPRE